MTCEPPDLDSERRQRAESDRRQRERRQHYDAQLPIDRRQPAFTRGPRWRVLARKVVAERLICMWRKNLLSDTAVWQAMRRLIP